VRRHAKASSAGPIQRQATGLGSFRRGALATRASFSGVDGSGARSHRTPRILALLCLAVVGAMALMASPAFAVETHPYTGLSFGPDGTASTSFANVQGVAVDQASGNVFVYDAGAGGRIYKFNAGGTPVNFSGLAGNVIENVGGAGNGEEELAIAPAGAPGGTAGDIYAANNSVVKVYGASGAQLGELTGGETCGVATNPAGQVFVGVYSSEVREYTPSANPATNPDQTAVSSGVVSGICNVGADGLGNVYAANYNGGSGLSKLVGGLGAASATPFDPSANTLAIDPSNNDVYANRRSEVAQYSSSGTLIGTFGAGQLSNSQGIAVNGAAEEIYAANNGNGKVDVFGPAVILPGLTAETATGVTGVKATLNASVNPDGLAVSECKFEYGTTTAYGSTKPCQGAIPTDSSDHPVSAAITGLSASTDYHFRVVATNANGTNGSADQTFTTNQPAVTIAATGITGTKATLNGTVFPEGAAVTDCKFEYGIEGALDKTAPCEGAVPTDEGEHPVTAALTHLTPNGTNYSFRIVIVVSGGGTVNGSVRSFSTEDTVLTAAATAIAGPTATLNGTLNPEGILYTECAFEYGTTVAYGSTVPCAESPATIGTGSSPVPVHADLSDLSLGSSYHFRLVGTNADGASRGGDRNFTTLGAAIEAEWASIVVLTEATLKAEINPMGLATTYRLEYGTDTSYGHSTPEVAVGSDETSHRVTRPLEGLTPGTTYHYRFVATNSVGASEAPDRTFTTYAPFVPETGCPNQALRTGSSANLPDCRAYEMVSPVDKNGGDILGLYALNPTYRGSFDQGSLSGKKITYTSGASFGDEGSDLNANQYISTRGATGWSTHGINPPVGPNVFQPLLPARSYYFDSPFQAFSEDLSSAWVLNGNRVPLTAEGIEDFGNLYRRDNLDEGYEALTVSVPTSFSSEPEYGNGLGLEFRAASADGNHQVFDAEAALTPDAAPTDGRQVYDFSGGQLHLVSVLPDGTPAPGNSFVGVAPTLQGEDSRYVSAKGAVSVDGSRIFWSRNSILYVRKNPTQPQSAFNGSGDCVEPAKACTIPVSESVTAGRSMFWGANPDGSRALFTFDPDFIGNTDGPGIDDLEEFDVETETSTLIAHEVQGVLGAAEDLSHIYFVSKDVLATGATQGEYNLYLDREGTMLFVATLSSVDVRTTANTPAPSAVNPIPFLHNSRVTPDGRHIAFQSNSRALSESVAGYDNTDAVSGEPDMEVYTYEAGGALICASCNPGGARPTGQRPLAPYPETHERTTDFGAAAWLPTAEHELHAPRVLSDDGSRLFFNSFDALVPRDTNGQQDVYEWERQGSGTCQKTGGCVSLITTGESPKESEFVDAGADGTDVFVRTSEGIDPRDPGLMDIYDVAAGGGFPLPPSVPPCLGDACQNVPAAPNDPTPASSAYKGPGNPTAAVRKKKAHKKKHRKKHGQKVKRHHAHTTNRNG
jgi:hypothetical protein